MLCTHGILHLLGFDHAEPREHATMFGLQDELLDSWRAERGLTEDAARRDGEAGGDPGDAAMVWLLAAAVALAVAAGLCASAEIALFRMVRAGGRERAKDGPNGGLLPGCGRSWRSRGGT